MMDPFDGKVNNKWPPGYQQGGQGVLKVPAEYRGTPGIVPMRMTLLPEVGPEMVLILQEESARVALLASSKPFRLCLNTGVVTTGHGPVLYLLYWVPSPATPGEPLAMHPNYLNPHAPSMTAAYSEFGAQAYVHVFLVDMRGMVHGAFEFQNTFRYDTIVRVASEVAANIPYKNFEGAKRELQQQFTVDALFRSCGQRKG